MQEINIVALAEEPFLGKQLRTRREILLTKESKSNQTKWEQLQIPCLNYLCQNSFFPAKHKNTTFFHYHIRYLMKLKACVYLYTLLKKKIIRNLNKDAPLLNAGMELEDMASLQALIAAAVTSCLLHAIPTYQILVYLQLNNWINHNWTTVSISMFKPQKSHKVAIKYGEREKLV